MNADTFPAILIGGPPHSGKSVLVYSLTRALRDAHVPHYVLRACPDGEGDWSNEIDRALVQTLRHKGPFSDPFMDRVAAYLQKRHLPLLVDVGGQPTSKQEAVFSHCTHAILLIGERENDVHAYVHDTANWQAIAQRQQLPIIAQIRSVLHGDNHLVTTDPIVTGTISGLERGATASGQLFEALVKRITQLFAYEDAELTARHLAQAPVELTLDLPALARTLGSPDGRWLPHQLPELLDYLPEQKSLALYGRAPNWIYAALTLQADPAPIWLFDARLGWIKPPVLPIIREGETAVARVQTGWQTRLKEGADYTLLEMTTQSQYLDNHNPAGLPILKPPSKRGLVLSGKVPYWLLSAAVRQLAPHHDWLAIYQPPLAGAIVIKSSNAKYTPGAILHTPGAMSLALN